MNTVARRIGRSLALALPVVLVLSGTLAVSQVNWSTPQGESSMLNASAEQTDRSPAGTASTPQDRLRDRLIAELREKDPGVALTHLQQATERDPSLAEHCGRIARALGRAAVAKYGSAVERAQSFSRPVCDTSFAYGVAQAAH
ncbi:hypothetical protein [Streptomyces sp. TP-A0874]|uniref:hypothetical protein n=1 Tax=Streptomyces sp. TP-A0874 TaxID=549819 RepID=UPI000853703B|nr:hypothetical protein [Streptomyces sp. TP-A0874]